MLFTLDSNKCNADGLCAAVCPLGCISFEAGQMPVPHEKKYAYCIGCGHCMAVCPTGALQLDGYPAPAKPMDRDLKVSFEQAAQFLKARRSARGFRNEPVGQDVIKGLLDITQFAPSGHNARPIRWAVAATPEKVRDIAAGIVAWMRGEAQRETPLAKALHLPGIVAAWDDGKDIVCRNAPALAVAYGPERGITPAEDGVIAVTYLELAATAAGLGACWCGYLKMAANRDEGVRSLLGIPAGCMVYGAVMLGRPSRRMHAVPPRPAADINWL